MVWHVCRVLQVRNLSVKGRHEIVENVRIMDLVSTVAQVYSAKLVLRESNRQRMPQHASSAQQNILGAMDSALFVKVGNNQILFILYVNCVLQHFTELMDIVVAVQMAKNPILLVQLAYHVQLGLQVDRDAAICVRSFLMLPFPTYLPVVHIQVGLNVVAAVVSTLQMGSVAKHADGVGKLTPGRTAVTFVQLVDRHQTVLCASAALQDRRLITTLMIQ